MDERIILTWEGSSINDPRIDRLIEQLLGKPDSHGSKRGGLPYISSIVDPRDALNVMQQNGIEPQEAARRLEGTLLGAGPLRVRLTEVGRSALKKTKRELQVASKAKFGLDLVIQDADPDLSPLVAIPSPVEDQGSSADPNAPAVVSVEGKLIEDASVDHDLKISWKGMRIGSPQAMEVVTWLTNHVPDWGEGTALVEKPFFVLGSPVALAIGISEAGLADKAETISAIRQSCDLASIPSDSLHMAGSVISSNELNAEVKKAVWGHVGSLDSNPSSIGDSRIGFDQRADGIRTCAKSSACLDDLVRGDVYRVLFGGAGLNHRWHDEYDSDRHADLARGSDDVRRDPCRELLETCSRQE